MHEYEFTRLLIMMTPEAYFNLHDLFNGTVLKQHADHNLVLINQSSRFPHVAMLHYAQEAHFEKKWSTFSKMSRGLLVDLLHKRILAYPFDKFFNLGEMPETSYERLKELGPFEVSEKLDGSMLTLFQDPTTHQFALTTKGSLDSDHGRFATKELLTPKLKNSKLVQEYTFIFELIDKQFQIVVDYKKLGYPQGLYLIGVRHRYSNKLLPYSDVVQFAKDLGVNTVKTYQFDSLDQVIDNTKNLPMFQEGYVLRFVNDGLLVKIKGTEYLRAHRFISNLSSKYLLEALGEGTDKDLIKMAPEEYLAGIEEEIAEYKKQKTLLIDQCYKYFNQAPKENRKDFALWVQKNVESHLQSFMYGLLDSRPVNEKKVYALIGQLNGVTSITRI